MSRRLNRRSFLTCVVGSSIVGGGAFARIGGARAQVTDQDPTDPRGRGRGITDRDSGPGADPAGRGRGAGVTDRDTGATADPAGRGRGRGRGASVTDSDSGANADPRGRGRGETSRPRCNNWMLNGTFDFVQSNNIRGQMVLRQNGDRVTGTARFYSPTLRSIVTGNVEGFIDGTNFNLRISWSGSGRRSGVIIPGSVPTYDETGIYRGSIASNGSIEGINYPYNRPRDRTTWFMRQRARCISR